MSVQSAAALELPCLPQDAWFAHEFARVRLGDRRRTERVIQLATALAAQPSASLPQACGRWAALKAGYRLLEGGRPGQQARAQAKQQAAMVPPTEPVAPAPASAGAGAVGAGAAAPARRGPGRPAQPPPDLPAALRAAHIERTVARVADQEVLLALQDTTELDFTHHPATAGLGPIGKGRQVGLEVHSTLAVTPDGVPQGLLAQQVWARDPEQRGSRHQRQQRATADKESQKWLTALQESRARVPLTATLVAVCDREADVFDFLALVHPMPNTEALVRVAQQTRRVREDPGLLRAHLDAQPEAGRTLVEVPRADDRPRRQALLAVRYAAVTVRVPKNRPRDQVTVADLPLWAILVTEVDPPPDAEPLEWLLLTTLPVPDLTTALRLVRWYCWRWRIERYHFVLKSGCRLEERQLGTRVGLEGLLALCSVIAVRLLCLQYASRSTSTASAAALVTPDEWQVVWMVRHPGTPLPADPTLRQAMREIAALGGFLGRKGDGEPGVITLWRRLMRLHDLLQGFQLAQRLLPGHSVGNA